jgi:nucleoside-diphosphate-sugar epimerase
MRILVTGASGVIGSELTFQLKNSGHEVIGISQTKSVEGIKTYRGSITDQVFLRSLIKDLENIDAFVHLAATKEDQQESKIFETNVYGTQLMIKTANELASRQFIMVSGVSIFNSMGPDPINEETPPCPKGPYLLTKYLSEQVLNLDTNFSGLKKIIRIPSPVGPTLKKGKIFREFIESAMADRDLEIWGDGNRTQNYLDLRDFCDGFKLLLTYDSEGVWNIAGPREISDVQLAKKVIETTKSNSRIIVLNKPEVLSASMSAVSNEKIMRQLNFKPKRSIEETIRWIATGEQ